MCGVWGGGFGDHNLGLGVWLEIRDYGLRCGACGLRLRVLIHYFRFRVRPRRAFSPMMYPFERLNNLPPHIRITVSY